MTLDHHYQREAARIAAMSPEQHIETAARLMASANAAPDIRNTLLCALIHAQLATAKQSTQP